MVRMTRKLGQSPSPTTAKKAEKRNGREESGNIPISFEELKNKYMYFTKWINS